MQVSRELRSHTLGCLPLALARIVCLCELGIERRAACEFGSLSRLQALVEPIHIPFDLLEILNVAWPAWWKAFFFRGVVVVFSNLDSLLDPVLWQRMPGKDLLFESIDPLHRANMHIPCCNILLDGTPIKRLWKRLHLVSLQFVKSLWHLLVPVHR